MPEFLLELYSEEIPPQLQINARNQLKQQMEQSFKEEGVQYKECLEYSSPTRLSIYIKNLPEKIKIKAKEIKGPKAGVPENILQGFTNSHNVSEKDLFKKETEKGEPREIRTRNDEKGHLAEHQPAVPHHDHRAPPREAVLHRVPWFKAVHGDSETQIPRVSITFLECRRVPVSPRFFTAVHMVV